MDDGFQTLSTCNYLPVKFFKSSSIFLPHKTRKTKEIPLESSIFTWSALSPGQLQSYQATPANFKANHRHRLKSRTSSAVLDMAATPTDLREPTRYGQVGVPTPNGNEREIFCQTCAVWESMFGFINVPFGSLVEVPKKVNYSRMRRICWGWIGSIMERNDPKKWHSWMFWSWFKHFGGDLKQKRGLEDGGTLGLSGHRPPRWRASSTILQPPNRSVVGFLRGTACWRSRVGCPRKFWWCGPCCEL